MRAHGYSYVYSPINDVHLVAWTHPNQAFLKKVRHHYYKFITPIAETNKIHFPIYIYNVNLTCTEIASWKQWLDQFSHSQLVFTTRGVIYPTVFIRLWFYTFCWVWIKSRPKSYIMKEALLLCTVEKLFLMTLREK